MHTLSRSRRAVCSCLLSSFAFACSDGGDEDDVDTSALCAEYTDTLCDALAGCCADGWSAELATQCRDYYRPRCVLGMEAAKLDEIDIREEALDDCLAALEPAVLECAPLLPEPPACDALLVGRLDAGRVCEHDGECQPGLTCDSANPDEKTCEPPVEVGESCQEDSCADGAWCWQGTCAAFDAQGDDCEPVDDDYDTCAPGLYCGPGGSCVEAHVGGADCTEDRECLSWVCVAGTCDRAEGEIADHCAPFFAQ